MDNKTSQYLFHQGTLYKAYEFMGCTYDRDKKTAIFRVYAPNANYVSVIGDFNGWNCDANGMVRITANGIWQVMVEGVREYDNYKYYLRKGFNEFYKADPYAVHSDRNAKCSKVKCLDKLAFNDEEWLKKRSACDYQSEPMLVYEAHLGSWRKYADGNYFNYRKLADEIVPYLKKMHYTHLELMGIAEYPFDASWGYQITAYYSPTDRYGCPEDFAYFINLCHLNNISVFLDWVPGHFPKDCEGLVSFDGECVYEPSNELRREQKEWGTVCFDYGRTEVQSFLVSNAVYWLDKYHIDGLRVDAVASMLYLDYGRTEWMPNSYGGNENLDAVAFLKKFNTAVHELFPGVLTIAEESTAWPGVTDRVENGGLGFDFKWNMGWMNDNLAYQKEDPYYRCYHHNKITQSMTYAFSENYILPISHDEVVHGKGSLIGKMWGEYEMKFAEFRAFIMNMYAHPGKKLLFMGTEFAQFSEWNFAKELDWLLLDYPMHESISQFISALNDFYITQSPLWEIERDWSGFEWLVPDDNKNSVLVFTRRNLAGEKLIAVINYTPLYIENYRFGIDAGSYYPVFTSDVTGWQRRNSLPVATEDIPSHSKESSIVINIPAFGAMYFLEDKSAKSVADKPKSIDTKVTAPKKAVTKAKTKEEGGAPAKKRAVTKK